MLRAGLPAAQVLYGRPVRPRADGVQRVFYVQQHTRLQCRQREQPENGEWGDRTATASCLKVFLRDIRSYDASYSGSVR